MKPVCVPCERFMRPDRNGVAFIEGMPDANDVAPGLAEPARWRPYKLWCGDRWRCPDCDATVIVGVAARPISEHYERDFVSTVEALSADLLVKDC